MSIPSNMSCNGGNSVLPWCAICAIAAAIFIAPGRTAGGVELVEDPPSTQPAKLGEIRGRIITAGAAGAEKTVQAVSRDTGKQYAPARFDTQSGEFVFSSLPGDATYDICLSAEGGREIQGIDLEFVDAGLLRLAELRRKELGLPEEKPRQFTRRDADELLDFVAKMEDFCDIRRVLYINGLGRRATALVELMRARDFHARAGDEIVWRVELWYFEYRSGGWEKLANQERVLQRKRIPLSRWRLISLEYYPQLSVYVDPSGRSEFVEFAMPSEPDPSRGRIPGAEPEIKTDPHILGLDATASRPAGD